MSFAGIFTKYSRFLFNSIQQCSARNFFTDATPLAFRMTDILLGEPLKKKKRLDPAVVRRREERRIKKMTKEIRRLQKHARKLKPITECDVPIKLLDEKGKRTRRPPKVSDKELDTRALLAKDWCRYKQRQHLSDLDTIDNMIVSQERALRELRMESEELYQAAITLDIPSMIPHRSSGPAAIVVTPPIPDYVVPDGDYVNMTKRYDGDDDVEAMVKAKIEAANNPEVEKVDEKQPVRTAVGKKK